MGLGGVRCLFLIWVGFDRLCMVSLQNQKCLEIDIISVTFFSLLCFLLLYLLLWLLWLLLLLFSLLPLVFVPVFVFIVL